MELLFNKDWKLFSVEIALEVCSIRRSMKEHVFTGDSADVPAQECCSALREWELQPWVLLSDNSFEQPQHL